MGWSEISIKKIEKFFHALPLAVGVGTAIAGLPMKLFNNSNLWCWISGLPGSCSNNPDGDGNCIRGDDAWIYRWAFFYAPLWGVILVVTILMGDIVLFVMREEKQSRRWRMGDTTGVDASTKLSKQVFWQAIHYVCSFYLTYTFPTTLRLLQTLDKPVPYPIFVLMTIFIPMQGVFNASVYFGPRIRRAIGNKRAMGASTWSTNAKSRFSVSGMEQSKSFSAPTGENGQSGTFKSSSEAFKEPTGENGQSGTVEGASETVKELDTIGKDDEIGHVGETPGSIGKRVDFSAEVMQV